MVVATFLSIICIMFATGAIKTSDGSAVSYGGPRDARDVLDRDKSGTDWTQEQSQTPKQACLPTSAAVRQIEAEGRGLEPPTGFPAPDFEIRRLVENPRKTGLS